MALAVMDEWLGNLRSHPSRGLYGQWRPTHAEVARLQETFPAGVCDYRKPDVGRPRHWAGGPTTSGHAERSD